LYIFLKDIFFKTLKRRTKRIARTLFQSNFERDSSELSTAIMLDYTSAIMAETVLFPLSLIIRKLQCKDRGISNCIADLWKKEGLRGFFGGFTFHLIDLFFVYFATMVFYSLSRLLVAGSKKINHRIR